MAASAEIRNLVVKIRGNVKDYVAKLALGKQATEGYKRDVNGKLRDLRGRFVKEHKLMIAEAAAVIKKGADKIGSSLKSLGTKLTIGVTLPIVALTASIGKAAVDAEEIRSKFATTFQSVSVEAEKMAQNLNDAYGLSKTAAKDLLANTGDLLTGFGFTQGAALDLSNQVQKLAVDLASFQNKDSTEASIAITKALLGERESIKQLGISILETDVQAKVFLLRQQGMTFESERQAKAYATLQIAYEQSKNAVGDYARTMDSAANQMRELSKDVADIKGELGQALLPVIRDIIGVVRENVSAFAELDTESKKQVATFALLAAAAGPVITGLGMITSSLGTLLTASITAGTHLKKLGALLAANPALAAAMAGGVIAIGVAYAKTGEEVEKFNAALIDGRELTKNLAERQADDFGKVIAEVNKLKAAGDQEGAMKKVREELKFAESEYKGHVETLKLTSAAANEVSSQYWGMASWLPGISSQVKSHNEEVKETQEAMQQWEGRVKALKNELKGLEGEEGPGPSIEEIKAQAKAEKEFADSIKDTKESFREQARTMGMSANEAAIWKAEMGGAAEHIVDQLRDLAENVEFAQLDHDIAQATQSMKDQVATFGMTSEAIQRYELAKRGATDAQLAEFDAHVQALEKLREEEKARKEQEKMLKKITKAQKDLTKAKAADAIEATAAGGAAARARLNEYRETLRVAQAINDEEFGGNPLAPGGTPPVNPNVGGNPAVGSTSPSAPGAGSGAAAASSQEKNREKNVWDRIAQAAERLVEIEEERESLPIIEFEPANFS